MLPIVGVLLAAGSSRRFGTDKLLHPLDDGTPMAIVAARRLRSACSNAIAVVRPNNNGLASQLRDEGLGVVVCDRSLLGMGHSLAAGINGSANAGGWLVALADMPYITDATYQRVIEALAAGAGIAVPVMHERRGHPVGFAAHWFSQLSTLSGDTGARSLLSSAADDIVHCPVDDSGIFRDIDSMSDLAS